MSPEEKLRLTHIAEAAALISDYVQGVSKEAFFCDTLRQDAVIRRIQISRKDALKTRNLTQRRKDEFEQKLTRETKVRNEGHRDWVGQVSPT
jgi:hypothetical protein